MIDILIVSKGENKFLRKLTQTTINTAKRNTNIPLKIYVLEQIKGVSYFNAEVINYDFSFNYNRVLNYGISKTSSPFILLANNDLEFGKQWAEKLIENIGEHYSASPFSEYNPHGNIYFSGGAFYYGINQ